MVGLDLSALHFEGRGELSVVDGKLLGNQREITDRLITGELAVGGVDLRANQDPGGVRGREVCGRLSLRGAAQFGGQYVKLRHHEGDDVLVAVTSLIARSASSPLSSTRG